MSDMKNSHWRSVGQHILFLLFPPKCIGCGEVLPLRRGMSEAFCPLCHTKWEASRLSASEKILEWPSPVCGLVSIVKYQSGNTAGTAERLIFHMKHRDEKRVFDFSAREMACLLRESDLLQGRSNHEILVTYPPRRAKAIRKDGFDQAWRLAKSLSHQAGYPCAKLLERVGPDREQKRLNVTRRWENAHEAYALKTKHPSFAGKTVILVDDLYTTGATLKACGELLVAAGADCVILATVGRTVAR